MTSNARVSPATSSPTSAGVQTLTAHRRDRGIRTQLGVADDSHPLVTGEVRGQR